MARTKLPPLFPQTLRHSTTLTHRLKGYSCKQFSGKGGDSKKPYHVRPEQEQALRRKFALLGIPMGEKRKMTLTTKL